MADASISMVLNRLAPIIENKIREEVCLLLNANSEAEKLGSKLKKIQEVLMDAEQKGVTDPKVKSWLHKLQDISYDIDEVLDEWEVEILKRQLEESDESSDHSLLHKVSSFLQSVCLCFRTSVDRRAIAKEIKKLNERLDLVAQENENEFKFIPNLSRESQDFKRITSTSIVDVSEIKGRDDDLELLMKKLVPESGSVGEDDTQIVSIVGTGGMGKTTLAQLAYNDNTVMDHFPVRIWVCVSHPFDEIKIAKAILEAVNKKSPDLSHLEALLQCIKDSIKGKIFLLVLDDVWTEDDTMWKPLKITLKNNGAPGSRILLTTRNEKVAKIMGSTQSQMQSLDPLSDSYCWSILSHIAFHGRNEGDREMLKEIGWEISLKCKGMPLAAKTLGSLLSFKSSIQEWKNVLKSKVWEMDEVRTNIFSFLALSYNELHPAVKRCFSYCAIFPKDFRINVDDLIRIWMAQGFLYSSGTVGEMELKGREYFDDLAMRSLFQDFERVGVEDNRVEWCKMHDLVHDFAQSLTNKECLIAENIGVLSGGVCLKDARHLTFLKLNADAAMDLFSHCQMKNLCSFMCIESAIPPNLLSHLKRVKLLNLSKSNLVDVPGEIGNLIHIRYLDYSESFLQKLPESICNLYRLQTLDLRRCYHLSRLPQGIHKLVNLRHLLVDGTPFPFEFTQGLEKLVNLQTLDYFGYGRGCGNKLRYLKDLNLLGGSLTIRITHLDYTDDPVTEAEKADLKNKTLIQDLTLHYERSVELSVIDALQPSPNLHGLHINGPYLPSWITTLINLRKLIIQDGIYAYRFLHSLRNLPFLEELTLYGLSLERLSLEFFGLSTAATTKPPPAFPKLKYFSIRFFQRLKEWDDIGEKDEDDTTISIFPSLRRLEISYCGELRALPHRLLHKAKSLQILRVNDCANLESRYVEGREEDRDKISHIPHVNFCTYLDRIKNKKFL